MTINERRTPSMVVRTPATMSDVREAEGRLAHMLRTLERRLAALETRFAALHLGSTAHPEWVAPGAGPAARARRAGIVEAVLALSGREGMTLATLAAYLHLPRTAHAVLEADLSYLIEEQRAQRVPNRAKKWRITER